MFGEVDQLCSLPDATDNRFLNRIAITDNRDHAAVVIGVHLAIE